MRNVADALVACLLALGSSCVSVDVPRAGDPLRLSKGQVLVFGRLRVLEGARSILPPRELEAGCQALARRHPRLDRPPVNALMFTDPLLSSLLANGSRARCDRILADHGVHAFDR
jgi:hypothetical protein